MSRARHIISVIALAAALHGCSRGDTPPPPRSASDAPAFIEFLEFRDSSGTHPALRLDPSARELLVQGSRALGSTAEVIPIQEGTPFTMCRRSQGRLAVAVLAEDGRTSVLGYEWIDEHVRLSPSTLLFRGSVGVVTAIEPHPATDALYLVDAKHARLFEVTSPTTARVLADSTTIPALVGKRSLRVIKAENGPGLLFSLTAMPPDTDSIDFSDGVLEIQDRDPTDGKVDEWKVLRP